MKEAESWIERHRKFWNDRLDALYGPKQQMRTTITFEALGKKTKLTARREKR